MYKNLKFLSVIRFFGYVLVVCVLFAVASFAPKVLAQTSNAKLNETAKTLPVKQGGPEALPIDKSDDESAPEQTVNINWLEKMMEGGYTMVALALLSIAGVAILLERCLALRKKNICPDDLVEAIEAGKLESAMKISANGSSILAVVTKFIFDHYNEPMERVAEVAGDKGGREIHDMISKINPLAAIAALAPLLGLLGTMIGMIEAFELVKEYGDDGGASMLAGSIAKALVTTAVGLIIAIPTIGAYHFLKHRINNFGKRIELTIEALIHQIYFNTAEEAEESEEVVEEMQEEYPEEFQEVVEEQ